MTDTQLPKVLRELERRAKLRAAHLGRKHKPEWNAAQSAAQRGRRLTEEHRATLRATHPTDHISKREVTCPHCSKVGRGLAMWRHHMHNCRWNPEFVKDAATPGTACEDKYTGRPIQHTLFPGKR